MTTQIVKPGRVFVSAQNLKQGEVAIATAIPATPERTRKLMARSMQYLAAMRRLDGLIVTKNDDDRLVTIGSANERKGFRHYVGKSWKDETLENFQFEVLPKGTKITWEVE